MWIDEFLELMTQSTIDRVAIDKAYCLKDTHLPKKIYKFRVVNEYALSNLEGDTVWLCSAEKYNDPYECATTWSTEELLRQAGRVNLKKIIERTGLDGHLSTAELDLVRATADPIKEVARLLLGRQQGGAEKQQEELIEALSDVSNKIARQHIPRFNQFAQRGMKICSFSSRIDSVVMWGHYAQSHTGFAIEYDVEKWPHGDIQRRILHPVIYREELFDSTKYHMEALSSGQFNNLFGAIAAIHKSPDWSYENEWRFVIPMGESFLDQNYPIHKPSAVYIGSRITPENKTRISEIAAAKGIPIYQMSLSTSEFKLLPEEIPLA